MLEEFASSPEARRAFLLQFAGFFLDSAPCLGNVTVGGIGLSNAKTQGEAITQSGMRQKEVTALVEAIHQQPVFGIAATIPEAHKIQWRWCNYFEAAIGLYPRQELLREGHVMAHVMLQTF